MNRYLLSLVILLPVSTVINAQENEQEEVEEVIVSGVKSSLKDAIDIKRKNVGVVDALTAQDLGKFPDGNLAEALSRLVGVTTERSNDEGTKVTVRGLGPEFNLVTLNGRTMPTVPPQYGGGRSFNFGDISSHGVAAVEVYKSANAVLPTGGLGSTINMVTAKPIGANKGGAVSVRAICTHAILSGDAYTKIENSKLEELIVTDSVPNIKPHSKIKMLSCADLFSDVMHKVHSNQSISSNFIM